jgi:hypothetical protein
MSAHSETSPPVPTDESGLAQNIDSLQNTKIGLSGKSPECPADQGKGKKTQ